MACTSGTKSGGDKGTRGAGAAGRSRERTRRERSTGRRSKREETKRRSLEGKGGELLICPLVDGARLSSLGVKGKVRTVVKFWFFYIVDHLLMRSLWLE